MKTWCAALIVLVACGSTDSNPAVPTAPSTPSIPTTPAATGICLPSGATPTTPPQTLEGELKTADCKLSATDPRVARLYEVKVTTGQTLITNAASPLFTPTISVFSGGALVHAGTNTPGSIGNRFLALNLAGGTYHVAITAPSTGLFGAYTLFVMTGVSCTVNTPGTPITLGQTVQGTFSATDCLSGESYADVYEFTLASPEKVRFDLTTIGIDSFLSVEDKVGASLSGSQVASPAVQVQLSLAAGTYRLTARAAASARTGSYTLAIRAVP